MASVSRLVTELDGASVKAAAAVLVAEATPAVSRLVTSGFVFSASEAALRVREKIEQESSRLQNGSDEKRGIRDFHRLLEFGGSKFLHNEMKAGIRLVAPLSSVRAILASNKVIGFGRWPHSKELVLEWAD